MGCGGFGALAEFTFADEPICFAADGVMGAATRRGAFRLEPVPELRAVAYETVAKVARGWGQGLVLCLPQDRARLACHPAPGSRGDPVRSRHWQAAVGDLRALGRSADVARLRAVCGQALFSHEAARLLADMPALSPHRVFRSKVARVEVYQPIPPPDGIAPAGPHTHVKPQLVIHRRSHAATVPIPQGWLPVLWLFPPHPLRDASGQSIAFDRARYQAFEMLLQRFGEPATLEGKAAFARGAAEQSLSSRAARLAFRIARRQADYLTCAADPGRRAGRRPGG